MMEDIVLAFLHTSVSPQTLHVHLVPGLGAMQIQAPRTVGAKYVWEARLESYFLYAQQMNGRTIMGIGSQF